MNTQAEVTTGPIGGDQDDWRQVHGTIKVESSEDGISETFLDMSSRSEGNDDEQ